MFSDELVAYLEELRANNDKAWFDANRSRFDSLRARFVELTGDVIDATKRFDGDMTGITPADCIFRINRDIRFSKDKSPYKTTFSAVLSPGKKGERQGYYYCIDADGSLMAGAGMHEPDSSTLQKVRQHIARDGNRLDSVLAEPKLKQAFGAMDGAQLKTAPRDYQADHPYIHYLRYKDFTVGSSESVAGIPDGSLAKHIADRFAAAAPFVKLLRDWCG